MESADTRKAAGQTESSHLFARVPLCTWNCAHLFVKRLAFFGANILLNTLLQKL
jgi:hypothetical protein